MGSTARGRARSETLTPSSLPAAPCHTKRFSLPDVAIAPKPHFNALAHCFPFVSERDVDRQARACGQSLPDLSIDWPRYAESERSDVLDLPPSLNQADVPLLLTHLDMILHRDHRRLSECMDVNQLYTLTGDDIPSIPQPESLTWGAPLRQVLAYSSASSSQGVTHHDLPLVIYACIKQLYRSIHDENLFRSAPSPARLCELRALFNRPYSFSARTASAHPDSCLRGERTADLCALLESYLDALPSPILPPVLWDAVWTWCVRPTCTREQRGEAGTAEGRRTSANDEKWQRVRANSVSSETSSTSRYCHTSPSCTSLNPKDEYDLETTQIAIARALLRLMPRAHGRTMCYILAFLAQATQYPDNGFGPDEAARRFARPLFGAGEDARAALKWFLARWERIADGLSTPIPSSEGLLLSSLPLAEMAMTPLPPVLPPLWDGHSPAIPGSPAFPLTPDDFTLVLGSGENAHTYFSQPCSPAIAAYSFARRAATTDIHNAAFSSSEDQDYEDDEEEGQSRIRSPRIVNLNASRLGGHWTGFTASPKRSLRTLPTFSEEHSNAMSAGLARRADRVAHGRRAESHADFAHGNGHEDDERSDETLSMTLGAERTPRRNETVRVKKAVWGDDVEVVDWEEGQRGNVWIGKGHEELVRRMQGLRM